MNNLPDLTPDLIARRENLLKLLHGFGSCAVAFSGGLDSVTLAMAAHLALGDKAVAVIGVSDSMAEGELEEARRIAAMIGIRLEETPTAEMSDAAYLANGPDRCYHCKSELLRRVHEVARRLGMAVVADGGNADDLGDYRPGRQAVAEQNVRSPLAECKLTKAEVRRLAQDWKLPIWDKPATPCLSSRIAYGERVTPERLKMIDRAERFLREQGFRPLRVRYHSGDVARIEVPADQIAKFIDEATRHETTAYLKSLGFKFVAIDLEGFRSGSLNDLLIRKAP
jgi:pyridinium-3,5-biscarboxylic acid mononucleotide sulfurtransferase